MRNIFNTKKLTNTNFSEMVGPALNEEGEIINYSILGEVETFETLKKEKEKFNIK